MSIKRFQLCAQIVGYVTIGLLALFGLLNLVGGGGLVWAAGGRASVDPARAEARPAAPAADTVPGATNFQGYLRDDEGNLMSGYYTMTFTIYDDAVVGSALWSEQQISVTVRDGYFSALLGDDPVNPFPDDLFASPERYIGVTVDPYAEMVPRQRFASVPYAFHAERANGLSAADGDPKDAVTVNGAGNVLIGESDVEITQGGLCIDSDGACTSPADGGLRVGDGGIHGSNSSGQNLYLVPGSGNVGVGTDAPSTKLDVNGDATVRGSLNVTSTNGDVTITGGDIQIPEGGLCIDSDGGCAAIEGGLRVGDGGIHGTTNSSNNVYLVPASGNVGVGYASTQALSYMLNVNGGIAWSGHLQNMVVDNNASYYASSSGAGSQSQTLRATGNSICFLTAAQYTGIGPDDEVGSCAVDTSGGSWVLYAYAESGTGNVTYCEAMCLAW